MSGKPKKSIFGHPGNLGAVRGSLLSVHHADWPAYPQGENFMEALFQLTAFPSKTEFLAVDDIDQSILFIADVPCAPGKKVPFDPRNFHIAIWYSDLKILRLDGYISGIELCTERQMQKHYWKKMASEIPGLPKPDFDKYEDDADNKRFIYCPDMQIQVTPAGRDFVSKSIRSNQMDINTAISPKVARLYELGFFDTCIREACVQLEHEIKETIKSNAWGDKLTNAFVQHLQNQKRILESEIRTFQQELRSLFKLIRNDFMHNLANVDDAGALVALVRVARVRSMVTQTGPVAS